VRDYLTLYSTLAAGFVRRGALDHHQQTLCWRKNPCRRTRTACRPALQLSSINGWHLFRPKLRTLRASLCMHGLFSGCHWQYQYFVTIFISDFIFLLLKICLKSQFTGYNILGICRIMFKLKKVIMDGVIYRNIAQQKVG
jgi:hypothetical protein